MLYPVFYNHNQHTIICLSQDFKGGKHTVTGDKLGDNNSAREGEHIEGIHPLVIFAHHSLRKHTIIAQIFYTGKKA